VFLTKLKYLKIILNLKLLLALTKNLATLEKINLIQNFQNTTNINDTFINQVSLLVSTAYKNPILL